MICPYCQHAFPLTWRSYFKSIFGRHVCPACAKVSRLKFKYSHFFLLLGIGLLCAVPGAAVILFLTSDIWAVLGVIPAIIVILPLDRLLDAKFKHLQKIEGQDHLSDTAACAECNLTFPKDSLVAHLGIYVCARCKPIFLQKLTEGAPIGLADRSKKSSLP